MSPGRRPYGRPRAAADAPPRPQSSPHEYALRLLTARSYTVRDLRRKLVQREYPPEEVAATIERLERSGLLGDASYAERFARGKLVNDSASRRRVGQLLVRKGIAADVVEDAIARVVETEDVDAAAAIEKVARKKMLTLIGLDPRVARQRLFAFLARRGYDLDDIKRTVARVSGR
ncbi:MAG: recombination regulator RecX [Gemmatimonadaceae bacterium]|nr:recombination regulator RecX [Gemmatimonadaceae bacterium]